MIAQDFPQVTNWCLNVQDEAGDFLKSFASAVMRADPENFEILWPSLLALMTKYSQYDREHHIFKKT